MGKCPYSPASTSTHTYIQNHTALTDYLGTTIRVPHSIANTQTVTHGIKSDEYRYVLTWKLIDTNFNLSLF